MQQQEIKTQRAESGWPNNAQGLEGGLLTLGLARLVGGGRPGAGLRLGWTSEGEAGWASGDRRKAAHARS